MSYCVAIDGPAASGKGTIARAVAARFGFAHLDTGLLYRAVGQATLRGAEPVAAARALRAEDLEPDALRGPDTARAASEVAAIPEVRRALVDFQRAFAARAGGAVLDGRDIGTVICPEAPIKLFVTAEDTARARRRHAELTGKGHDIAYDEVLADIRARDARDARRPHAPMRPADDAIHLDTTHLSVEAAIAAAVREVELRRGSGRSD